MIFDHPNSGMLLLAIILLILIDNCHCDGTQILLIYRGYFVLIQFFLYIVTFSYVQVIFSLTGCLSEDGDGSEIQDRGMYQSLLVECNFHFLYPSFTASFCRSTIRFRIHSACLLYYITHGCVFEDFRFQIILCFTLNSNIPDTFNPCNYIA